MAAWLFETATEQQWATAFVLMLLLSSDNFLTGYEKLSYYEFNRNLSICILLVKSWFMLHKHFNKYLATYFSKQKKKMIHVKEKACLRFILFENF